MSKHGRWFWFSALTTLFVILILALSWIAGGPEELHQISQPVAVPELPQ